MLRLRECAHTNPVSRQDEEAGHDIPLSSAPMPLGALCACWEAEPVGNTALLGGGGRDAGHLEKPGGKASPFSS